MRFRFKPSPAQRAALQAQLERLRRPAAMVELLADDLPASTEPDRVRCDLQKEHSDRFVLRVLVRGGNGTEHGFAVKVYSDDFGERVWAHAQALAARLGLGPNGVCLPIRYHPQARALVFPWVEGESLSEIVDDRKPELLRAAARLAAGLHRVPVVPERRTTTAMLLEETRGRCERLRRRRPETTTLVGPLMTAFEETASSLEPAAPAPVHGDMAAGQFIWTGDRLVLLDLDMFGYAEPAYDVGHFLAQLERRRLFDADLPAHASEWLACFRDTYLAAMPEVPLRNVWFYHGLTLVRKIYTICRREPEAWPRLVPLLAGRAWAALNEAAASRDSR